MQNPIIYSRQTSNVINGTSLQGYVQATYQELVDAFGDPEIRLDGDTGYKVKHLWVINIEGVICSIYDYKEDLNTGKPENWHIGGKQKIAERLINQIIEEAR